MARADGTVSDNEICAFHDVLRVPPEQEKRVEQFWYLAQQGVVGYEAYASQIMRFYSDKIGILEDVLAGLFHVALADGSGIDSHEEVFLVRVSEVFGFSHAEFQRIYASHMGLVEESLYLVLELESGTSLESVREAWRHLVRENHPDRLDSPRRVRGVVSTSPNPLDYQIL